MLELLAIILAGIHFGIPLIYYSYAKVKWLRKPWNIKIDEHYKPRITVVVPTYNEAKFIREKLDNLCAQNYPRDLIEVLVVDSASEDGTTELIKKWISEHGNINLELIEESQRKGKLPAILKSLDRISAKSDIVVFTDADAFWEPSALSSVAKYFADPNVGAVTSSIVYSGNEVFENVYRGYYNAIRIAESKVHSTPVHNGPFLAIRTELLRKFGLPTFSGSDDSSFGSYVAFLGFRAIQVDDIIVKEPVRGNQFRRKVRRAQHLLLSFLKTKRYVKKLGLYRHDKQFERIWKVEWWLHVVNPWLLVACALLLAINAFYESLIALLLLGAGSALLISKVYRMWMLQQLYLVVAAVRNIWTREIVWGR